MMKRGKRALFVSACGLAGIGIAGTLGCEAQAPEPPAGQVALPLSAITQMQDLLAEKDARTPAQKKISSQLLYLRSGRFTPAPGAGGLTGPTNAAPGTPGA